MVDLAAFLGNPGRTYAKNRHNAAWLLAESAPFLAGLSWRKRFKGSYAGASVAGALGEERGAVAAQTLHFLKPDTFMNASGESIREAAAFYGIPPDRIIVAHDELDLELGTVSFKFSGGLNGHNGLRSMKACLGTADFWRLRIGIGRPGGVKQPGADIYGWVLSDFTAEEEAVLRQTFAAASEALLEALRCGPESLLPEWGKKKLV
jgi:PTH1 family peptidyl-tRNA hydrolase